MSELLSTRRIDTRDEIQKAGVYVANHPQGYGSAAHEPWVYDKMLPRLVSGQAEGVLLLHQGDVAAVGLTYSQLAPDATGQYVLTVEQKVLRASDDFKGLGLGRSALTLSIANAAISRAAPPGTPVTLTLDTRDPGAMAFYDHLGLERGPQAPLYKDQVADQIFTLRTYVPLGVQGLVAH